jgi:hypothetical protein
VCSRPARTAPYVPLGEFRCRLTEADIVITHVGATVRLVQRLGRLPLVVPRLRRHGEAPDDSQTAFLRAEEAYFRVHPVWDLDQLTDEVAFHPRRPPEPLPPPTPPADLIATMSELCERLLDRGPARLH